MNCGRKLTRVEAFDPLPAVYHFGRPSTGQPLGGLLGVNGDGIRPLLQDHLFGLIKGVPGRLQIEGPRVLISGAQTGRKDDPIRFKCSDFALVIIRRSRVGPRGSAVGSDNKARGSLSEDEYATGLDLGVCEYTGEQKSTHKRAKIHASSLRRAPGKGTS